ncbi:MAG: hypothetical protein GY832_43740 [Chloroflexi bacterium]|nr:hypothetical protein [Chloroflexota bacterium]
MSKIQLGQIVGLQLSAMPSTIVGFVLLWILLGGAAIMLFQVPLTEAIAGSFVAVVLHYGSEIVHNLGHAWAARRTGYPMTGIRLFGVLGMSRYPRDEPPLPANIHIRRALGGPAASLLLSLVAAAIALLLRPLGGTLGLVTTFFFLENLILFALGSLLPLGFTDGSTLLKWWSKQNHE